MANNAPVNQYKRDYIKLYPNGNKTFVDIKNMVTNMTITESLHQTSLLCTMDILDGLNMLEDLQLEGDERIELQLSKETPEGKIRFHKVFFVSDIINYVRPKPGVQTYQLILVSEHAYLNQLMEINRKFEGNIGKLVNDILHKDLEQNDNVAYMSNSNHTVKGIYPSLRPINAIKWLTRNAFDNGYPFYFYETLLPLRKLTDRIFFQSLKEIAEEEVVAEYEHKAYYSDINPISDEDRKEQRKKILSISTPTESSVFGQLKKGAYGSTLSSIDIATKTVVIDNEYRYDDEFVIKDNKYRSFKKEGKFLDKAINDFPYANSYYASLNSLAYDKFKNYHDATSDNIRKASSKTACMESSQINVKVCGDPRIRAGSKVLIKIPKSIDPELKKGTGSIDKNKSGVYIVYDIEHLFNYDQEYHMKLLLKKDTSRIDYDSTPNGVED